MLQKLLCYGYCLFLIVFQILSAYCEIVVVYAATADQGVLFTIILLISTLTRLIDLFQNGGRLIFLYVC